MTSCALAQLPVGDGSKSFEVTEQKGSQMARRVHQGLPSGREDPPAHVEGDDGRLMPTFVRTANDTCYKIGFQAGQSERQGSSRSDDG